MILNLSSVSSFGSTQIPFLHTSGYSSPLPPLQLMPRLPHALLLQAHRISTLLPLVLRACRELPSALNELRWLREHVEDSFHAESRHYQHRVLLQLCRRRARGEPLQYLLGTQPFGQLEIKCRPGVLIPRTETEAYTAYLAQKLVEHKPRLLLDKYAAGTLNIVDYCSGSGCISLLLFAVLSRKFTKIKVTGVDISPQALALANENLQHNIMKGYIPASATSSSTSQISFEPRDIFSSKDDPAMEESKYDIIISNPPYISQNDFNTDTSRSVRNWEPKLALVPRLPFADGHALEHRYAPEDVFYYQILKMHQSPRSKLILMEVGDWEQAVRVAELAARYRGHCDLMIEIWRDWPDQEAPQDAIKAVTIGENTPSYDNRVRVIGDGIARAVVVYCGDFVELSHRTHLSSSGYTTTDQSSES